MKNKNRRNKFNEIGTPPQPVLTRWSTWLNVAEYYAKNLVKVREIVNAFEGDGLLVSNAKAAVNDPNVAKLLQISDSVILVIADYLKTTVSNFNERFF